MYKQFYAVSAIALLMVFTITGTTICAQKPGKASIPPAAANFKKPLVKSFLGKVTGNVTLSASEASQAIILPLTIKDDKNVEYLISSYQFVYKRIGVKEDEETGITSPQSDITANRFTTTPLTPVWQKNIIEQLHKGEELYFFDIIVFDKTGRRFFAPELKITIR